MRELRQSVEVATPADQYTPQKNAVPSATRRKPLPNDIEAGFAPDLDPHTIRNRRLETANAIEPTLDYASVLISTASTYLPERLSLDDERRMRKAHGNPDILNFVREQSYEPPTERFVKRENPIRTTCMLLPRLLALLVLFTCFWLALGLAGAALGFWLCFTMFTGFTKVKKDRTRIVRDNKGTWRWLVERWRDI